jgi:hypothetical protein
MTGLVAEAAPGSAERAQPKVPRLSRTGPFELVGMPPFVPAASSSSAAQRRRDLGPVVAVAVLGALGGTVWSALHHSMLLYGDARAHLDVARHVTDGLRAGLAQLGSVWLPLPHLLLVPFTAIRALWHSGAAGAIVSGVAYVYGSVRIFTLIEEISGSRVGAWIGFAVFAVNLNLLYVQSTALTEPVLLAFMVGAAFHLARWMRQLKMRELMWAATLACCATLSRYEGWAFLAACVAAVWFWGRIADRRDKSSEANVVVFCVIGAYGIALWFVYNAVIFHDALYFLHSAYSAQAINGSQAKYGLLGTKGNVGLSALTYGWDVVDVVSPIIAVTAVVSAVLLAIAPHRHRLRTLVVLAVLGVPVIFEFLTLYAGQITIRVPQLRPHEMWNVRYGLMALPFCAVAIGTLAGRASRLTRIIGALVLLSVLVTGLGTPITLADGRAGVSSAAGGRPELAAQFLQTHYRGGEVLADDAGASSFMFAADLDLEQFVSPGAHPYWEKALVSPARYVAWVVATPGDGVSQDLSAHPDRFRSFRLVDRDRTLLLFERTVSG